jgi:Mn2+/Fe2+ NRAMP family transporter
VQIPWGEAERGFIFPTFSADAGFWTTVVAILGTTISPYLFFWQASQEAEDTKEEPERAPLAKAPQQGPDAIERIRLDTYIGMALSNAVALAIMITTAATLHKAGIANIESSSQAAEALRPVAGSFAFAIFTLGIMGTGLLAVPVLAGSAAYAIGEARKWPTGLSRKPKRAKAFYGTIAIATLIGVLLNFTALSPIRALYWSAVVNGIVAVPVLMIMMRLTTDRRLMGQFPVRGILKLMGWMTTGVMAASVLGMGLAAAYG